MERYRIVRNPELDALVTDVNGFIGCGWDLWGDPFHWNGRMCQAMVRPEVRYQVDTAATYDSKGDLVHLSAAEAERQGIVQKGAYEMGPKEREQFIKSCRAEPNYG